MTEADKLVLLMVVMQAVAALLYGLDNDWPKAVSIVVRRLAVSGQHVVHEMSGSVTYE